MVMKWWESKEEGGKEVVIIPPEIQEQLNQGKENKIKLEVIDGKLSALDSITEFINQTKAEREEQKKPKPVSKTQEDPQAEREELAGLLLTDPETAYAKLAAHTNTGVMQIAANIAKREVFMDNPEDFPYYTGEVKKEIDTMLSSQTLQFQANHEAIKNTYYTIVGKKQKDILEGKIKDRFVGSANSSRTTPNAKDSDDKIKITEATDDIKRAAMLTGIKVEDYLEMLNKDVEAYI